MVPPKDHTPVHEDMMVYDDDVTARRLRHELHVLPGAAATHRARPDPARSRHAGHAGQPRVHDQPPLRAGRRRGRPHALVQPRPQRSDPSTRRIEHPQTSTGDRAMSTSTEYDAIVIGGGHNGLVNGAYLAKARSAHADPRATQLRRWRGDHRRAPARLQVHHVLVRAQPAAARHHPRARPREARLHAAADARHRSARWRTATAW